MATITKIKGRYYDLSSFAHPGGHTSMQMAHKRDATALFGMHHALYSQEKLTQIIAKYEVAADSIDTSWDVEKDVPVFEWHSEFQKDLAKQVTAHFTAEFPGQSLRVATKATSAKWLEYVGLHLVWLFCMYHWATGAWWSLVAMPVAGWLASVLSWHDATHFAWSSKPWVNNLVTYANSGIMFSSPLMWYHEHVIGHHCYTNVGHKDPDLAHDPSMFRFHDSIRWKVPHAYQVKRMAVRFLIGVPVKLHLLGVVRTWITGSYNGVVKFMTVTRLRLALNMLGRVLYTGTFHVWPLFVMPLHKALFWITVPMGVYSTIFIWISQVSHLNDIVDDHQVEKDWYKHQVRTALNVGNQNMLNYYLSGGLNYQIEHHLLPTINSCHLPALAPIVRGVCKKHDVPYHHVGDYVTALRSHINLARKMNSPDAIASKAGVGG